MRNPLSRRLPRELRNNLGRYLGMFVLLVVAIMFTSGFLTAASSIEALAGSMRDRYNVSDLSFTCDFKASDEAIAAAEDLGGTVYEQFFRDVELVLPEGAYNRDIGIKVRVFKNRGQEVDQAIIAQGRFPEAPGEIAVDRVFCQNHRLSVGDVLVVDGREMELVGIMTFSNATCTFEKNSDFIFNAVSFTEAVICDEAFEELTREGKTYRYVMVLDDRDMSLPDRIDLEEDLIDVLTDNGAQVSDLVDRDSNQETFFAADDVSGDQVMWEVLLFLLIVIMAFVFVVLTDATIEQESAVIGTLLASGWRKRELIAHYMVLPTLVGLLGCAVGQTLGCTVMMTPMQELYYNSYGFPPFELVWSWRVFSLTTVVPFVLLVGITLVGLLRKMGHTPLQFLRHEVGRRKGGGGMALPDALPFPMRFRLRVFLRNFSHFATLFAGIAFGSLLLMMGLCLLPTIDHFAEESRAAVVAQNVYLLKAPLEIEGTPAERDAYAAALRLSQVEAFAGLREDLEEGHIPAVVSTMLDGDFDGMDVREVIALYGRAATIDEDANPVNSREVPPEAIAQAEKFSAASLQVERAMGGGMEEVTAYGIQEGSRYWSELDVSGGRIIVGAGLAQKCALEPGGTYEFYNKYQGESYQVTVSEVWGSSSNMNVYMGMEGLNEMLGYEPAADGTPYFSGYASDMQLDLDERYVSSVLTPDEMSKMSDQMEDSMGDIMRMIVYMVIPVYFVLMYLLTKTVIDRSARSISYMKVFGYHALEIDGLYILAISVTVVASMVLCLPLLIAGVDALLKVMMMRYAGNIVAYLPVELLAREVLIGCATYAVVAAIHVRAIRRVPLSIAMKVQE